MASKNNTKTRKHYVKICTTTGVMAQAIECLLCKCKALNSNHNTTKIKINLKSKGLAKWLKQYSDCLASMSPEFKLQYCQKQTKRTPNLCQTHAGQNCLKYFFRTMKINRSIYLMMLYVLFMDEKSYANEI
jgi:hypothetical protein